MNSQSPNVPKTPTGRGISAVQTKFAPGQLWRGFGEAWTSISYIAGGILVWGGAGFLADRVLATKPVLLVVGTLLGNFGGIYLVYLRLFKEAR